MIIDGLLFSACSVVERTLVSSIFSSKTLAVRINMSLLLWCSARLSAVHKHLCSFRDFERSGCLELIHFSFYFVSKRLVSRNFSDTISHHFPVRIFS